MNGASAMRKLREALMAPRDVAGRYFVRITLGQNDDVLLFLVKNEAGVIAITHNRCDFILRILGDDDPKRPPCHVSFCGLDDTQPLEAAFTEAVAQCVELVDCFALELYAKQRATLLRQRL
jgi:hypothetical protein